LPIFVDLFKAKKLLLLFIH